MTDIIDYYEILGVIPSAETAVIKAAYRALVSIYHPDKNPDITTSDKIVGIQGKSMNAQFLFAARIPATITCSR